MKGIKGILAILLSVILLCCAANVHTTASTHAPHWENEPADSGDFVFWDGTEMIQSDSITTEKIQWIQNALNWCIEHKALDAETLVVDGKFGPACHRATVAFQEAAGLPADGSFGPLTIQTMKRILQEGQQSGQKITCGSSSMEVSANSCNCTADQKCSDCSKVHLFSAVNDLKAAVQKSPAIETLKKSIANALQSILQNDQM